MQHCDRCHVDVGGAPQRCPLCQGALQGSPDPAGNVFPTPARLAPVNRGLLGWFALGSVGAAAICVAINLSMSTAVWWSLFVVAGLASLWATLLIAYKKRRNLPKNILWLVCAISLLAFLWDRFNGWRGWSVDYVIPILATCALVAMAMVARIWRLHIQDYMLYLLMDSAFGILSLVFILTNIVRVAIPSAICFAASAISMAALLIFEGRALWAEVQRRLHL